MSHQRAFSVAASVAVAVLALLGASCQSGPSPLVNPPPEEIAKQAPDSFKVLFETSKGQFTIQVNRAWAPIGADRFYFLANNKYYDGTRFFRVLPNFVVQWGIHGDPKVAEAWATRSLEDEPVKQSNQAGIVTYAMGGPNSRTVQVFINKADNSRLDGMGFAPFGRVIDGMHVVEQIHAGYGGDVKQDMMRQHGQAYLDRWFPKLDYVVHAKVVP